MLTPGSSARHAHVRLVVIADVHHANLVVVPPADGAVGKLTGVMLGEREGGKRMMRDQKREAQQKGRRERTGVGTPRATQDKQGNTTERWERKKGCRPSTSMRPDKQRGTTTAEREKQRSQAVIRRRDEEIETQKKGQSERKGENKG